MNIDAVKDFPLCAHVRERERERERENLVARYKIHVASLAASRSIPECQQSKKN